MINKTTIIVYDSMAIERRLININRFNFKRER